MIETTFLIIGGGPAGASLACFLAAHHFTGILIDTDSGTTRIPKAHITNPASLECLRSIGLEEEAKKSGMPLESMENYRWGHDMAGEEYARVRMFGHHPEQKGHYSDVSPCTTIDLPQTLLEPILIKRAIAAGWTVRYDSMFVKFDRESPTSRITSTILDKFTGQTYQISSKYLFGCEGARSPIMRQLDIPLLRQPSQGLAFNIIVNIDLSKHVETCMGNLHWCLTPEIEHPPWGFAAVVRAVKPWNQWMFVVLPQPGYDDFKTVPTHEEIIPRLRQWIGDDSLPFEIVNVSKWLINEIVAERYSDGNIFCLGDAVHRHPLGNGLGSNTCIQDAWNLAWKLSYVEYQNAGPKLLDSFSLERQPIGVGVVARANQCLRDAGAILEALGMLGATVDERIAQHAELSAATEAGRARRKRLHVSSLIIHTHPPMNTDLTPLSPSTGRRPLHHARSLRSRDRNEPTLPLLRHLHLRRTATPGLPSCRPHPAPRNHDLPRLPPPARLAGHKNSLGKNQHNRHLRS
jgi:2-polyprenyl-6-methoxyphenol hydroxylase-like FAD-dependent oxidoreductase